MSTAASWGRMHRRAPARWSQKLMKHVEFRQLFDISDQALEQVRTYGRRVTPYVDAFIERIYEFLRRVMGEQFTVHFPDARTFERAQAALRRAWLEFWQAPCDEAYMASREHIGNVHAQLQLDPRHYLAAMAYALKLWTV